MIAAHPSAPPLELWLDGRGALGHGIYLLRALLMVSRDENA